MVAWTGLFRVGMFRHDSSVLIVSATSRRTRFAWIVCRCTFRSGGVTFTLLPRGACNASSTPLRSAHCGVAVQRHNGRLSRLKVDALFVFLPRRHLLVHWLVNSYVALRRTSREFCVVSSPLQRFALSGRRVSCFGSNHLVCRPLHGTCNHSPNEL